MVDSIIAQSHGRGDDMMRKRNTRNINATDSGDKCMFWERVGACRHGNKCAKYHNKPKKSKTVVFWKLFQNPIRTYYSRSHDVENNRLVSGSGINQNENSNGNGVFKQNEVVIDDHELTAEANRLYQDLFVELATKYGEIDSILVCGNYNPHVGGNVLVKFRSEKTAAKCCIECNDRWYNGKPIFCELSPVTYFEDAICKEFNTRNKCERGDQCNLIHARKIDPEIKRNLLASQKAFFKERDS